MQQERPIAYLAMGDTNMEHDKNPGSFNSLFIAFPLFPSRPGTNRQACLPKAIVQQLQGKVCWHKLLETGRTPREFYNSSFDKKSYMKDQSFLDTCKNNVSATS